MFNDAFEPTIELRSCFCSAGMCNFNQRTVIIILIRLILLLEVLLFFFVFFICLLVVFHFFSFVVSDPFKNMLNAFASSKRVKRSKLDLLKKLAIFVDVGNKRSMCVLQKYRTYKYKHLHNKILK